MSYWKRSRCTTSNMKDTRENDLKDGGECSGFFLSGMLWQATHFRLVQRIFDWQKKISYLENQSRFTCPPWQMEWCGCRWQSPLHGVWRLWKRWLECQSFSRVMYFSKGLSPLLPPACTQKYRKYMTEMDARKARETDSHLGLRLQGKHWSCCISS